MCPRIAVVGAGITGVLTALACARKGAVVDIYDEDNIPNKRSNSWAYARLCRVVHEDNPYIEELSSRSEAFWINMMHKTDANIIRPINIIRVNNENTLNAVKASYEKRKLDNNITSFESSCLGSLFNIKDNRQKVLTGKDGFLLSADSIYQILIDKMKKHKNIKLIPNSNLFNESVFPTCEREKQVKKYSNVIFCTSAPVSSDSRVIKKMYQYHVDFNLQDGNELRSAILDLGDHHKTWCIPSLDGRKLKLSASEFSFNALPSETVRKNCLSYLLDILRLQYTKFNETVSIYYAPSKQKENNVTPWRIDTKNGYILMESCNAQHYKIAPALAEDISNYVFE